jgi:biotin transporter BioY
VTFLRAILNIPFVRRSLGILIGFAPVGLAIGSFAFPPRRASILSLIALTIAALLAAFNFYLVVGRPWLHRRRGLAAESMRHVSGIPGIASIIILHAVFSNLGSRVVAVAALITLAVDSYGLPWALIAIWKDRTFWEEPI